MASQETVGSGVRRRRRRLKGRQLAALRVRVFFAEYLPRHGRMLSLLGAVTCIGLAVYLGVHQRDEAHVRHAGELTAAGAYRQAIAEAATVTGFPTSRDAHVVEANALALLGDLRGAIAALKAAVRLDPKDAQLRYQLALDLLAVGERRAARREMKRVLALDPRAIVLAPAALR